MALLFIVFASPAVLVQVYLTPPIQVADEENHFLRSLQIAGGHVFGRVLGGGNAGGELDPAAAVFAHSFDALKFRPDVKFDAGTYAAAAALRWSAPREPTAFANTAIYPFFLYLPGSAGIGLGRASGMSVLDTFYLGRLATALAAIGLAALALAICGRGRTLLFVILCFPMSLSLFASVSQDAMAIAIGSVAAALWSGFVARDVAMPAALRAVTALGLGAIVAARLPLFPLFAIPLLPTRSSGAGRLRRADWAAAALGLGPIAIGVYGAEVAKVAFREDDGVSPIGQLRWLATHPGGALQVAAHTLGQDALRHLREMVGVLGWLDTDFPSTFYVWSGICVLAAVAIDALSPGKTLVGHRCLVPIVAALAAAAGVFGAFYLAWTPVGAPLVDGVQGRYFILSAVVLAVSLPRLEGAPPKLARAIEPAGLALCGAVALVDLWVVPVTLLHRYYG